MKTILSKNIEYLRKNRDWTQKDLAEKIGKVRQTIANWERGDLEPKASELDMISNIFDVSMPRLMRVDMEIHGLTSNTEDEVLSMKIQIPEDYMKFIITRFNAVLKMFMDNQKMKSIDEAATYLSKHSEDEVTDNTLYNIRSGRTAPSLLVIGTLKAAWSKLNINYIFDEREQDITEPDGNLKNIMFLLKDINRKISVAG